MTTERQPMLSKPTNIGARRSVSFFGRLPNHIHIVWSEWFNRHGINPGAVAYPGGVAADDSGCFIEFYPSDSDLSSSRQLQRVQLEAPALPFPVTL